MLDTAEKMSSIKTENNRMKPSGLDCRPERWRLCCVLVRKRWAFTHSRLWCRVKYINIFIYIPPLQQYRKTHVGVPDSKTENTKKTGGFTKLFTFTVNLTCSPLLFCKIKRMRQNHNFNSCSLFVLGTLLWYVGVLFLSPYIIQFLNKI